MAITDVALLLPRMKAGDSSDSYLWSGISDLSFDSPLLSPLILLPGPVGLFVLSIFCNGPFSWLFFQKMSSIFIMFIPFLLVSGVDKSDGMVNDTSMS